MAARSHLLCTLLALTAACNCGSSKLDVALPDIHVAPTTLNFGDVYLQATPTQSFTVFNSGLGSDTVSIQPLADGGVFSVGASSLPLASGGSVSVSVGFAPLVPGSAQTTLNLSWSNGAASMLLQGTGLAWPPCAPANACETATFDPNAGTCSDQPVADGTACDGGDVCLIDTACANGQCLGMLNPCSDGDACTTDYCVEGQGCRHDGVQCTGSDPCPIYACDPQSGCTSTQAPNGTPCSATESCQSATVCLFGACTGVSAPNGTPCALSWAPCVDDATCQSGACDSPTADAYQPGQRLWHFDAGVNPYYPVAVDSAGTSYPGFYDVDAGWVLAAVDSCGRELWQVPATSFGSSLILDGDVYLLSDGSVTAFSAATGAQLWGETLYELPVLDGGAFQVGSGALSNQGILSLLNVQGQYNGPGLLALYSNGALDFTQATLPSTSPYTLFADSAGNTYAEAASFDALGRRRFSLPGLTPLAIGADYLLAQAANGGGGVGPLAAYSLVDGSHLYDGPEPFETANNYLWPWQGVVIDAAGTAYVPGVVPTSVVAIWAIQALGRDGGLLWSTPAELPESATPLSPLTLGDPGTLFMEEQADAGVLLVAFDTANGAVRWQRQVAPNWRASDNGDGSPLALSSASELLVLDPSGLTAYFANQAVPAVGAPWVAQGGDASNRNCVPP